MDGPEIRVWHGSIGDADVDVLVNASNTLLKLGSGVSAAIRMSCGAGFQAALDELLAKEHGSGLEPGAVVMTDAHQHPRAKYVAHVAVMDYRDGKGLVRNPDQARLETGYRALFEAVERLPEERLSVGLVALGAGTGGFGLRNTVSLACAALRAHLDAGAHEVGPVTFVAFDILECANTLAAVREHFTVNESGLSEDVLKMTEVVAAG